MLKRFQLQAIVFVPFAGAYMELGHAPPQSGRRKGGRVLPQPLPQHAGGLEHSAAEAPLHGPHDDSRLSQLEDRVSLLEASTSMTYGMLKKVLRALRAQRNAERETS